MNYREEIHSFVVNNFLFGDGSRLKDETSFLGSGIIDSTGILEVISFVENRFGITVNDRELLPENLDSINNLVAFIQRKTSGAQDQASLSTAVA